MTLGVHIAKWIIEDGNYGDFAVGDIRQFAIEFYSCTGLRKASSFRRQLMLKEKYSYHIVGEVVFILKDVCVLDFGVFAYSNRSSDYPAGLRTGDFVEGEIVLGIDPYFYFQWYYKMPDIPPLIYEWRIKAIEEETTPWVRIGESGKVRDETQRSFASVTNTDESVAQPPDGSSYVMHCSRLDREPLKLIQDRGKN